MSLATMEPGPPGAGYEYVMIALSLAAVMAAAPFAQTGQHDFVKTWDNIAGSISSRYYAHAARKAEMNRLLDKYGPIAKKAKDEAQFEDAVNKMIADFGDSHFGFFTPADQSYYVMDGLAKKEGAEMPNIGAWFRKADDGYTVQMVLNGSEAEKSDIRKGDVIEVADGQPFTPVSSFESRVGRQIHLKLRRGKEEMDKQVQVEKGPPMQMFLQATRDSTRVIEQGGHKFGYFHLWTQANDDFRNALAGAVAGKLNGTDGFILDLRDGFGGRPEGFGDPFFRPSIDLEWKFGQAGVHQAFGYQKPLVVLINGGSRSAKEVLSYIFKKSGRATLVGSTTAGNVLGTFPARVNDWSIIEIPIVEVFVDGIRLEKVGVAPDVKVLNEFDEKGKDLYIDEALKVLQSKIGHKAA